MRGLTLTILFFASQAFALTGEFKVDVQKSKHGDFKGLFWNDVDETIGGGSSPTLTPVDLQTALHEEFADPAAALARLEAIKGPEGRLQFRYGYTGPFEDSDDINGNLEFSCGITDKSGKILLHYGEAGAGISLTSKSEFQSVSRRASNGKFFQFKWASKAQMKRDMARCFSRFPGMPPLKKRDPKGPVQFLFPDEIYNDFFSWLSSYPGIAKVNAQDPQFRKAVGCLLSNAVQRNPDRSGNVVVIQKAKNIGDKSPYNRGTFISEVDNLPNYSDVQQSRRKNSHFYSLAFMDQHSSGNLKKNWESDALQTQGIWPNYQGGSVTSLMAQAFGDQLHVNLKACLLDSGLKVPDINAMLPTIYDPIDCQDVDTASLTPQQQLEYRCEAGTGGACFQIGTNLQEGQAVRCLPKEMGGKCHMDVGPRNLPEARKYFNKACDLGHAEGCYALAKLADNIPIGISSFLSNHIPQYQKACKMKDEPGCFYWNRGVDYVHIGNVNLYEASCKGQFHQREACHSLGLYHLQQGDKARAMELLNRGCQGSGFRREPSPCLEMARIHIQDNNKQEAIKVLKKECSFIGKVGCKELYELVDEKEKKKLIENVCWQTKKLCF